MKLPLYAIIKVKYNDYDIREGVLVAEYPNHNDPRRTIIEYLSNNERHRGYANQIVSFTLRPEVQDMKNRPHKWPDDVVKSYKDNMEDA